MEKGIWTILRWWWVADVTPDVEMLDALRLAVEKFLYYLRANAVRVNEHMDEDVRQTLAALVK